MIMSERSGNQRQSKSHGSTLDPRAVWELFHNPMLRWGDIRGSNLLAERLLQHPEDPYLAELAGVLANEQAMRATQASDPFYANPPPARTFPPPGPGAVPIACLPTGDVLSIPISALCKNLLVVGATGGGKTNFLKILIAAVLEEMP